ncbi:Fpg/Nei family DNA glycosylase [Nocardioides jensenii]|uniref:Fpg/Nei family DNA glycosylase n=1 Tax=Nocardioides jensenii TaxID=1843 RepID=UPI000835EE07|nr:DNA-formamidopyrimidine glycosylase family protein [Nocardioides jensenii]
MPEGHTLRKLANDLHDAFAGRPVRVQSPTGRSAADAAVLDGAVLVEADSVGKHLFVEFEGERFIHVHLGLIGKFDVAAQVAAIPHPQGQVRLRIFAGGEHPAYADLRGATQCELLGPDGRDAVVAKLGPDPLRADADPERAWRRITSSHRPIGDLLMDQAVLAGVGNVYRAEVLFRHRMHPLRPGNTLRHGQFLAIWEDLVALMSVGVVSGRIDTVRPEHEPQAMGRDPRKDDHGGEVYVYRRTGQACHVCGSRVRTEELVGRNSFWCPRCQPRFRSRAGLK